MHGENRFSTQPRIRLKVDEIRIGFTVCIDGTALDNLALAGYQVWYMRPQRAISPPSPADTELVTWCERLKWNITDSRLAILRAVQSMQGYLTADDMVALAQKFHDKVSRATVYRALPQLSEAGLLHKTDVGDGAQRFCRATPGEIPSAEIYVEDCGMILKVPAPFLTWYADAITSRVGLKLTGQRLQTFARCSHKKAGGDCNRCPQKRSAT